MRPPGHIAEWGTKAVTWPAKGLGLLGAANQLILNGHHVSGVALIFSGCLIAGAESFERVALHAVDRMFDAFSGPEQREEPPPPSKPTPRPNSSGEP